MKTLLFLSIMVIGLLTFPTTPLRAQTKPAQVSFVSRDTSNAADTVIVTFAGVASGIKSFQTTVTKLSGTVGGKVYLQGTIDGNAWVNIDSLSNTNIATNTKLFPVTTTHYYSYRAYYISTGTQSSILTFSYMRRPDE